MTRGSKDQLTTQQILILLLCIIISCVKSQSQILSKLIFITLLYSLFVRYISGYSSRVSFDKDFITSHSLWLKLDRKLLPVCQFHKLCCSFLPFALPSGPPAGSSAGTRAGAWWGWTPRAGHRSCTAGCWRSPAPCTPQTTARRRTPTAVERKKRIR